MNRLSEYSQSFNRLEKERHFITKEMRCLIHDTLSCFRQETADKDMTPNMEVRVIDCLIRNINIPYLEIKNIIKNRNIKTDMDFYYSYDDGEFYDVVEDIPNYTARNYENYGILDFDVDINIINKLKEIL